MTVINLYTYTELSDTDNLCLKSGSTDRKRELSITIDLSSLHPVDCYHCLFFYIAPK